MKIILSRKGFDSTNGGQPSPILPDGTLLSLPIPYTNDIITFDKIFYNQKSYYNLIRELKPSTKVKVECTCHLDPDIRKSVKERDAYWKPIFGQCDAAQGHLNNNNIKKEDIFLFFGWFKQTEEIDKRLRYVSNSPDIYVIYGYLQIGEKFTCESEFPVYSKNHAHSNGRFITNNSNCIYVASDSLSLNNKLKGAGCLKYNPKLVLTKSAMSRAKWKLPDFFKQVSITYNSKAFQEDYFQSAAIGQEFVIEENDNVMTWVKDLIESSYDEEANN